jgi:hypothetical protein
LLNTNREDGMIFNLVCLALKGASLTEEIGNQLVLSASEMLEKGSEKLSIASDHFEGVITTGYKWSSIGTFSGIKFKAEIESDLGKTDVDFILKYRITKDILEKSHWFSSSQKQSRAAAMN